MSPFIETPKCIKSKRAIVNIKNKDDRCILYSLCAFKHYHDEENKNKKDKNRPNYYTKYFHEINVPKDISYPIDIIRDLPKFEKENNIKINAIQYTGEPDKEYNQKNLQILYNSIDVKVDDPKDICNLLILNEGEKQHITYIIDLGKLMRNERDGKRYPCPNCLSKSFLSQEKLNEHYDLCGDSEKNKNKIIEKKIRTNILKKIGSYKFKDKNKFNKTGDIKYEDVIKLLFEQNNKCYLCNDEVLTHDYKINCLHQFSLDRLDNRIPHNTNNIKISCYFCNCKDHYLFDKTVKECCNNEHLK